MLVKLAFPVSLAITGSLAARSVFDTLAQPATSQGAPAWVVSGLLGIVTLLLAGAWNDLRRRDQETQHRLDAEGARRRAANEQAREERERIFHVLEGYGRDIAVLLDRQGRYEASQRTKPESGR